jgi:hypothetical protein
MSVERSRLRLLAGGAATLLLGLAGGRRPAGAAPLPGVTVYKDPT